MTRRSTAAGKRGFHAIELNVRLKAHIESRVRHYNQPTSSVACPVRPRVPKHAVLYTAHYDHLGIDPDAKGDDIYNGAADNGTGCGILLELARAFAQSTQRPPHAIYFAAVTAEEQGLLGSQYLGMHPPVPAREIALDLNYDMLLPIGVPLSASLGGAERIDFWPTVQTVAKDFDLKLLPDPIRPPATTTAPIISRWRARAFPRFPSIRDAVRRPRRGLGPRAVRRLRRAPLPSALRRVSRRLGFPRQRQDGAVRVCARLAGQ